MNELDEVVQEFLVESYENLDQLEQDLLALEENPTSIETLSSVFRTVHTIKGTCGFLGYSKLEHVAHVGENLLSKLRDRALDLTPAMASALLNLSDALREMLTSIESEGSEGSVDYTELTDRLSRLKDGGAAEAPAEAEAAAATAATTEPAETAEPAEVTTAETTEATGSSTPTQGDAADAAPAAEDATTATATDATAGATDPPSGATDEAPTVPEPAAPAAAAAAPPDAPEPVSAVPTSSSMSRSGAMEVTDRPGAELKGKGVSDTSIRVDVGLLDNLMTLVGELVLARNQIVQMVSTSQDTNLAAVAQRLNLITTELQEGAMKTRMQPIGNLWSKFPRIVRDLAVACEKSVRLEMEGQDTELDKTIIEAIRDPLTHLVRNAVDHGIEPPDARSAVGKDPEGRLSLRAYHEGGTVTIEISDDGGGIDPERLRANAVAKNVVSSNQAAAMNERELLQLIFAPGFSTAPKVTNVSGRGVGMDVVRTNIEKIGGTVDVQSTVGQGTVLRIKIPLTLAIIPALVIASGHERYAIPQISLVELVRLDGAEARAAVETIHGAPVYRLRGRLLPLVYLHEVLGTKEPDPSESVNIVVLQADDRQFGLVVEGVRDSAEIVVKPLGHHLKGIPTFAGATIMGDGLVGLILDVMGLAQLAHVVGANTEKSTVDRVTAAAERAGERQALLLFATPDDGRMAIPLAAVDRLEEFSLDDTEAVGSQDVIQYRGQIMPLVHVSSVLPERRMDMRFDEPEERKTMHVVVHRVGERRVGLVVDRIHDIVEDNLVLAPASRAFTLGTVVVNDRVTEVIDLPAVLDAAGLNDRTIELLGAA